MIKKKPLRLIVRLEGFAGNLCADTFQDACAFAERMGVYCSLDVNGVHVLIKPGDDPATVTTNHAKAMKSGGAFKFASGQSVREG